MRVEKSRSKRASCSICGLIIKDELRLLEWGSLNKIFYHIDCLIRTADGIRSCKNLRERVKQSKESGINVTEL